MLHSPSKRGGVCVCVCPCVCVSACVCHFQFNLRRYFCVYLLYVFSLKQRQRNNSACPGTSLHALKGPYHTPSANVVRQWHRCHCCRTPGAYVILPQVYNSKFTCQKAGGLRMKVEWRRVLARLLSYTGRIEVKCAWSLDQPKPSLNGGTDVKTACNVIRKTKKYYYLIIMIYNMNPKPRVLSPHH